MGFADSNQFSITNFVPTWFANQTERTWSTPVSNTPHAVRPIPVPGGANVPPGMGESTCNIMYPWCGGTVDQSRKSVVLWGGGHGDYHGNEAYECVLNTNTPAWTRITNPSTASGGSEALGQYGDGQPRSFHTYGYSVYCDNVARCVQPVSSACSFSGFSGSGVWRLERNPNTWTRIAQFTTPNWGNAGES